MRKRLDSIPFRRYDGKADNSKRKVVTGMGHPPSGRRQLYPNSTIRKIFFSYFGLVVLLLVILSSLLFGEFLRKYQENFIATNVLEVEHLASLLSMRLAEMDDMALQMQENARLTPYRLRQGGFSAYEVATELHKYTTSSRFVSDVFLYLDYDGRQTISSGSGLYTAEEYERYKLTLGETTLQSLIEESGEARRPVLLPSQQVMVDLITPANYLFYLYPIPSHSATPYEWAIFVIENGTVQTNLKNVLKNYEGFICMLDAQHRPIAEYRQNTSIDARTVLELVEFDQLGRTGSLQIEGENYSTVYLSSPDNDYSYLMVAPTQQLFQQANQQRYTLYTFVGGLLLLGLLLSLLLSHWNYKPIRTISNKLRKTGSEPGRRGDDLFFIGSSVDHLLQENSNLSSELEKASTARETGALRALLNGRFTNPQELEALFTESGISLPHDAYAVIDFRIDHRSAFCTENSRSMQYLLEYCICNCMQDLAAVSGKSYGVIFLEDAEVAVLVNYPSESAPPDLLFSLGTQLQEVFREHFQLSLTAGLSDPCQELAALPAALSQARAAVDERLFAGGGQVISQSDVRRRAALGYWLPAGREAALTGAFKRLDQPAMLEEISALFQDIRTHCASRQAAQFVCADLTGALLRTAADLEIPQENQLAHIASTLYAFEFEDLTEAQRQMERLVIQLLNQLQARLSGQKSRLKEELLQYVSEHFSDTSLSLERIAEQFSLSPSYIARYFKEQTGHSLMQHVDRLRLARAKQLLRETSLSLQEIMDYTGYIDKNNFIRKFKKIEAITPMQYRTLYQEKIKELLDAPEKGPQCPNEEEPHGIL